MSLALLVGVTASAAVSRAPVIPAATAGATPASTDGASAKLAATFPTLEAFLAGQLAAQPLPSLAVGVIAGGALVYQKGFGSRDRDSKAPVNADTIYRIGSVTKTFTGLAIETLRDQGKLSLDDPAVRYLPELAAVKYPTADRPAITLRHLLTHSSGLPRLGAFNYAQADHDVTEVELLGALTGTALLFPPGTQTLYSNFGFGLLGVVVKRVAGVPYRDYISRVVFTPLGMTQSRWTQNDVPADRLATAYESGPHGPRPVAHWRMGASEAAGGAYSSVRDLGRYVAAQLVAARTGGAGLGWQTQPSCAYGPIVWHNGGTEGYGAYVAMLPQHSLAVVALSNLQFAELEPIVHGALHILDGAAHSEPRGLPAPPRLSETAAQLAALSEAWNESTYATLLAPGFTHQQAQDLFKKIGTSHGRCRVGQAVDSTRQTKAVFTLLCERDGALMLDLTTTPGGGRVIGFWILPPLAWSARQACPPR